MQTTGRFTGRRALPHNLWVRANPVRAETDSFAESRLPQQCSRGVGLLAGHHVGTGFEGEADRSVAKRSLTTFTFTLAASSPILREVRQPSFPLSCTTRPIEGRPHHSPR